MDVVVLINIIIGDLVCKVKLLLVLCELFLVWVLVGWSLVNMFGGFLFFGVVRVLSWYVIFMLVVVVDVDFSVMRLVYELFI